MSAEPTARASARPLSNRSLDCPWSPCSPASSPAPTRADARASVGSAEPARAPRSAVRGPHRSDRSRTRKPKARRRAEGPLADHARATARRRRGDRHARTRGVLGPRPGRGRAVRCRKTRRVRGSSRRDGLADRLQPGWRRAARGELTDRLEHPHAPAASAHQALVEQLGEHVKVCFAHRLDRLERPTAREDREPCEKVSLGPIE